MREYCSAGRAERHKLQHPLVPLDSRPQHVKLSFLLGPLLLRVPALDPEPLALGTCWFPTIAFGLALSTGIAGTRGTYLRASQYDPRSIPGNQNLPGGSGNRGVWWAETGGLAERRDLPRRHGLWWIGG